MFANERKKKKNERKNFLSARVSSLLSTSGLETVIVWFSREVHTQIALDRDVKLLTLDVDNEL